MGHPPRVPAPRMRGGSQLRLPTLLLLRRGAAGRHREAPGPGPVPCTLRFSFSSSMAPAEPAALLCSAWRAPTAAPPAHAAMGSGSHRPPSPPPCPACLRPQPRRLPFHSPAAHPASVPVPPPASVPPGDCAPPPGLGSSAPPCATVLQARPLPRSVLSPLRDFSPAHLSLSPAPTLDSPE